MCPSHTAQSWQRQDSNPGLPGSLAVARLLQSAPLGVIAFLTTDTNPKFQATSGPKALATGT